MLVKTIDIVYCIFVYTNQTCALYTNLYLGTLK